MSGVSVELLPEQWAMILDTLPNWTRFIEYRDIWGDVRAALTSASVTQYGFRPHLEEH